MMDQPPLSLDPEVAAALTANRPVVALETTIVSHGMPWPQNLETALVVEDIIRGCGAVPATIAVVEGRLQLGLDRPMLESIARDEDVLKLSRADLAYGLASGRTGGLTVAATMIAAKLAGIKVFATGGIGGVHRGAEKTFDISADLHEFARTNVTVVAAGPKALLDLPMTLEVLETLGVPVICYQSDEFPAFWSRSSGMPAPIRLDTAAEIATLIRAREALDLDGGVFVANPVPSDSEIPPDEMAEHIETAITGAESAGITGKALTPFLLDTIYRSTEGRSLQTNIALVKNNALLAAQVAVALTDS